MAQDFFIQNRNKIIDELQGGILVVAAYDKMQQTNDAAAPFKQESNFWWLSGIDLPGWRIVIDASDRKSYLVRPDLSESEMLFESWCDDEQATKISGISDFLSPAEFVQYLKDCKEASKKMYTLSPVAYEDIHCHPNPSRLALCELLLHVGLEYDDAEQTIARLRAIKTDVEIAAIQKTIDVTNRAFESIKQRIHTFTNESQLAAEFTYEFMKVEATHAYGPIVASNHHACTLHYEKNNAKLENGLVLLDIGACIDGYNADITRTYALGEITERQRMVHAAVVDAQTEIISLIKPGLKVKEYLQRVDIIMKQKLIDLDLIRDMDDEKYRKYFPHAISHGLGVDVHDSLGRTDELKSGMVLTVEPGIYIPEEQIGVRIEDDILVTEAGYRNLSQALSREP